MTAPSISGTSASPGPASDPLVGTTLGVTGAQPRWTVTPWGSITPWGQESPSTVDWYVAADDRWHVPADDPTVRQARLDGTPVVETRIRVPDGDAVQRAWSVPDGGGAVVVEFENESPKAFAVALTGGPIATERPPADVPVQGIDLADDAIVLPVGHRATVRVVVATPDTARPLPGSAIGSLAPHLSVVRGWTRVVERASRLVLPDERLVDAVVAARCDLLLEGPVDVDADPIGFLLDVAELVRCGDSGEAWLLDTIGPAEHAAREAAHRRSNLETVSAALDGLTAVRVVATAAGDERAVRDIDRSIERTAAHHVQLSAGRPVAAITSFADLRRMSSVGRFVRSIEQRIVDGGRLLVGGIPTGWLGSNFEVHGVPSSPASSMSFAVRWHGERPAILWEQSGGPITLTAPDVDPAWSRADASGEALWAAPPVTTSGSRARSPLSLTVDPDGDSFT